MYVFFAEHGGTIQTISSNTNQEYVTIHCEGEMSGFVVLSNGKFYSIGGGNYASKFVIDNGKAVTGKRYSLINSSICSTGNSGQEYFPGDIAGTIETDTYCVYK